MKKFQILPLALIFLFGCGNMNEESMGESYTTADEGFQSEMIETSNAKFAADYDNTEKPIKAEQKIIRTANLSIQSDDYLKYIAHIRTQIGLFDGYVSSENEKKSSWRISNDFEIRVPNEHFDDLLEGITKGDGFLHINSKRIDAKDVGEEYADIEARLKTKKAVESQYLEILTRAKTIEDILAVREKIRVVREEIDAFEGRRKYLDNRVRYSTIHLEIFQSLDGEVIEKPGFFHRSGNAFKAGWKGIQEGIIILFGFWPIWILLGLVIFWWRRRRARRRSKS